MTAKTISMYPETSSLVAGDLFLVSKSGAGGDRRTTNCVGYGTLTNETVNSTVARLSVQFEFGDVTSVSALAREVHDTVSADVEFSGTKTFDAFPLVTDSTPLSGLAGNALVTKDFLEDMSHSVGYIGSASIVSAAPNQTAGSTGDYENLYHWNIDAGGRDSS